jgi:hypothetical protein
LYADGAREARATKVSARAEFYVAVDGNDDGPGTKDRPWATINHAADVAEAGTRVIIREGLYALRNQVHPRHSGRPEAWIEFVGYPGETAVLDAAALQRPSPTALSNGAVQIGAHGRIHHNLVHHLRRQGIYVDAWFGKINDIEIVANVVHDCHGSGIALSAENGTSIDRITIRRNLVFGNDGSGLYFSRWGADNARRNITIANNVFHHNGYGNPAAGQDYYWQVGGIYLYSNNVQDVAISDNILSENRGFQIGYSELFLTGGRSWLDVAHELRIGITGNLLDGADGPSAIRSGGNLADQVMIYAVSGDRARLGDPRFKNPAAQDFRPEMGSPAFSGRRPAGAYRVGESPDFWWRDNFPPAHVRIARGGIVLNLE